MFCLKQKISLILVSVSLLLPLGALAQKGQKKPTKAAAKKKAGFYLSTDILNRFTLKFHELKLAGVAVDNKSTLLELALGYALDDLDKGSQSRVLKKLLD
jgi:hypothetical protein